MKGGYCIIDSGVSISEIGLGATVPGIYNKVYQSFMTGKRVVLRYKRAEDRGPKNAEISVLDIGFITGGIALSVVPLSAEGPAKIKVTNEDHISFVI